MRPIDNQGTYILDALILYVNSGKLDIFKEVFVINI